MPRRSPATLGLALLALLAVPALPAAPSKSARKPPGKKASSQPAQAPLPQELPPVAPTVTYRGGLLTIVAPNSTLQDILTGVHQATGAAVDTPTASASERVATHLGPGQPRDVLSALLNGSRFDYILLSSPENPGGLRRLILSPRSGGGAAPAETLASPPGALSSRPARPSPGARTLPPDTGGGEVEAPEENVEPAQEVTPEPEPQVPPPQPELKTPQQIQEEFLRRQEEQRQQPPQQPQQPQPPQQEEQPPQ